MSTITFSSLTFTGTPDAEDVLAARHEIFLANKQGANLPFSTAAQIKSSYLVILLSKVLSAHMVSIESARDTAAMRDRFTDDEIRQITSNLLTRLNAGESASSIVADTAA